MADLNLQEIHDLLVDVAHEAGRMMLAATPSYLSSGTKKNCSFLSPPPHQRTLTNIPQPQIS
jgi:myo-inositol-1(or 4)-monophosphatase